VRDSDGKAARERSPLRVFGGHPARLRLPRPRFGQNSHRKGISLTNPLPCRGRTTWGERRLSPAGGRLHALAFWTAARRSAARPRRRGHGPRRSVPGGPGAPSPSRVGCLVLPVKLTRRDFLKVAGAGTTGVAALGASATLGSRYEEYLPRGGSKVNVILVIVNSLGTIKKKCLKTLRIFTTLRTCCASNRWGINSSFRLDGRASAVHHARAGDRGPRTKIRT
jgi:hypothetical protein